MPDTFPNKADSFIQQCEVDDIQQGFADIEDLQNLGYANFEYLIENSPHLANTLLKDYLYFDLLDSLFPNSKNLKIVVNNIKSITIKNGQIMIYGETFPFVKKKRGLIYFSPQKINPPPFLENKSVPFLLF